MGQTVKPQPRRERYETDPPLFGEFFPAMLFGIVIGVVLLATAIMIYPSIGLYLAR